MRTEVERDGEGTNAAQGAILEVLFTRAGAVEVRRVPDAWPGPGQVKVQTILSGISHGTELNLLRGTAPGFHRRWDEARRAFDGGTPAKRYPIAPGYESVGRIVATGPGVPPWPEDHLVWLDRPHRSTHVVDEDEARRGQLPPGVTPERGIFCALTRVALGAVHDAAIKVGDRVAIIGMGAIGLLCVQLARLAGAIEVFAIERRPERLRLAREFGAIAVEPAAAVAHVKDRPTQPGVDVALETSGDYSGLQLAIACCAVGGSVVAASSYQGEAQLLRLGEEFHRNRITLISSMTVNGAPHRSAPHWDLDRLDRTARRLLGEGIVRPEPILTHVIPLEDAPRAYALLLDDSGACVRAGLRA